VFVEQSSLHRATPARFVAQSAKRVEVPRWQAAHGGGARSQPAAAVAVGASVVAAVASNGSAAMAARIVAGSMCAYRVVIRRLL
jgi:hypothetical protein